MAHENDSTLMERRSARRIVGDGRRGDPACARDYRVQTFTSSGSGAKDVMDRLRPEGQNPYCIETPNRTKSGGKTGPVEKRQRYALACWREFGQRSAAGEASEHAALLADRWR
jgi:hypothetical protein